MQNKPNLLNAQMNVRFTLTKHYENKRLCRRGEKQTQSNPISIQKIWLQIKIADF